MRHRNAISSLTAYSAIDANLSNSVYKRNPVDVSLHWILQAHRDQYSHNSKPRNFLSLQSHSPATLQVRNRSPCVRRTHQCHSKIFLYPNRLDKTSLLNPRNNPPRQCHPSVQPPRMSLHCPPVRMVQSHRGMRLPWQ